MATIEQGDVPVWLWRTATWGLVAALAAVLALAGALALGWADPPRAGPLVWQDDFKRGTQRWVLTPPAGGALAAADGALVTDFTAAAAGSEPEAIALTPEPDGDYTLEIAGAAVMGETAAAY